MPQAYSVDQDGEIAKLGVSLAHTSQDGTDERDVVRVWLQDVRVRICGYAMHSL